MLSQLDLKEIARWLEDHGLIVVETGPFTLTVIPFHLLEATDETDSVRLGPSGSISSSEVS